MKLRKIALGSLALRVVARMAGWLSLDKETRDLEASAARETFYRAVQNAIDDEAGAGTGVGVRP
jgi:hypothetical protein